MRPAGYCSEASTDHLIDGIYDLAMRWAWDAVVCIYHKPKDHISGGRTFSMWVQFRSFWGTGSNLRGIFHPPFRVFLFTCHFGKIDRGSGRVWVSSRRLSEPSVKPSFVLASNFGGREDMVSTWRVAV